MINKKKFDKQYKKSLLILETDDEDTKKRKNFIRKLSKKLLPMPQNEGQWHAARIYIDEKKISVYNLEQWEDYLKIKNKHPYYEPRNEYTNIKDYKEPIKTKKIKKYRNGFYYSNLFYYSNWFYYSRKC